MDNRGSTSVEQEVAEPFTDKDQKGRKSMGKNDRKKERKNVRKSSSNKPSSDKAVPVKSTKTEPSASAPVKRSGPKTRINENNLTKLLAMSVLIFGILIIVVYLYYFSTLKPLSENMGEQVPEEKVITMPYMPYKMYSIKRADLLAKLGEGIMGEGVSQDTKYVEYTQNWFNIDVNAKYYYGKETRVYETILSYEEKDIEPVYENMKKRLGKPIYDNYRNAEARNKETFWIKDSVNIFLRMKEGKPEVEMHMAYYENPDNLELGDRPTIVQQMQMDVTGDGEEDTIMLIGTKPEYTTTVYKHLFLLVDSKDGKFYTGIKEFDGGESPQMSLMDIDKDGDEEFLVTADLDYIMNYNAFTIDGKNILNVYSSDINPLDMTQEEIDNRKKQENTDKQ